MSEQMDYPLAELGAYLLGALLFVIGGLLGLVADWLMYAGFALGALVMVYGISIGIRGSRGAR